MVCQFEFASTILHELAHAIWDHHSARQKTNPITSEPPCVEPCSDCEVLGELGSSTEGAVSLPIGKAHDRPDRSPRILAAEHAR
ncbi:hypothetical protein BDZ45DRAFT_312097 [Acephala macrosclerotiorum]|nr:hypothetical protein BDZ45DRAFT_312097 [Acephala macrosclerotiorum]